MEIGFCSVKVIHIVMPFLDLCQSKRGEIVALNCLLLSSALI